MYISTDLDAIKTNDIWLFLLENDLTHSIFHFEGQCINFREGADVASDRPPSFGRKERFRQVSIYIIILVELNQLYQTI